MRVEPCLIASRQKTFDQRLQASGMLAIVTAMLQTVRTCGPQEGRGKSSASISRSAVESGERSRTERGENVRIGHGVDTRIFTAAVACGPKHRPGNASREGICAAAAASDGHAVAAEPDSPRCIPLSKRCLFHRE